jgi:hypothetical protein
MIVMDSRFVICVKNEGYPSGLEVRKVYRALVDERAESRGLVRVVDESGEDYLFPADFFAPIVVPQKAESLFQSPSA